MKENRYENTIKAILEVTPSLKDLIPERILFVKVDRRFTGGKEIAIIGMNKGVEVKVTTPLTKELKEKLGL